MVHHDVKHGWDGYTAFLLPVAVDVVHLAPVVLPLVDDSSVCVLELVDVHQHRDPFQHLKQPGLFAYVHFLNHVLMLPHVFVGMPRIYHLINYYEQSCNFWGRLMIIQ